MAIVETGARLHFGFQNLSLAHERLYGGIGVGLETPTVRVEATPADEIHCEDDACRSYLPAIVDALDVDGATVTVHDQYGRHVGLGSGTQLVLASLVAIASADDIDIDPREVAPQLGRGGRSGVGVATFETGGFVVDAGHRTARFTTRPPDPGEWTVPPAVGRWQLPADWRFVLVRPERTEPISDEDEDDRMRTVVERADPGIADDIATLLSRRLLPAVVEQDVAAFGAAVARLGRLNGAWYADEQGGVYRPPAGRLVEILDESPAIFGSGQSSWGSTVYGVTTTEREDKAREMAEASLDLTGLEGDVSVTRPARSGHRVFSGSGRQ